MRYLFALVVALGFPVSSLATEAEPAEVDAVLEATPDTVTGDTNEDVAEAESDELLFMDAREVDVREFVWTHRIIVVMADTPDDPQFTRQLEALRDRGDEFVDRDAVVIFDAHPEDSSPLRQVMRPRAFMTAIIDKDGEVKARRPAVRTGRELMAVIDRFPTRRQEVLERLPSGR
ncbi:MAG: DUF4174 domain-containing protein [Rhodobacteraceae bacterium]|nr:MAG: DUF4174 domain-containing protein [Paracoccaceae bacterium]